MEHISEVIKSLRLKSSGKALSDTAGGDGQYTCSICRDAHYVHLLKEDGKCDYSRVVPCVCVKEQLERERAQRLLKYCELPAGTAHMTFENFEVSPDLQEAYDSAVQVAEGKIARLTLLSPTNRGKTHLVIAICRRWLQLGRPARYAYVPLLFEELRRGFREEGDRSYEARFDFFLNVPLLVLDDLGAEHRTEWVQEKLDIIIDRRIMQGLPLVVATNYPLDKMPFRIKSRLKRASTVIVIDAPEFRKRKGGQQRHHQH